MGIMEVAYNHTETMIIRKAKKWVSEQPEFHHDCASAREVWRHSKKWNTKKSELLNEATTLSGRCYGKWQNENPWVAERMNPLNIVTISDWQNYRSNILYGYLTVIFADGKLAAKDL